MELIELVMGKGHTNIPHGFSPFNIGWINVQLDDNHVRWLTVAHCFSIEIAVASNLCAIEGSRTTTSIGMRHEDLREKERKEDLHCSGWFFRRGWD